MCYSYSISINTYYMNNLFIKLDGKQLNWKPYLLLRVILYFLALLLSHNPKKVYESKPLKQECNLLLP